MQETGNDAFNPVNDDAKRIADKIMRGRQRVAAQHAAEDGGSTLTRYLSILAVGLNMELDAISKLTLFQLYDLIERYMLNSAWDVYVKQRLAGAQDIQEPENWMKPIH